MTEHMDRLHAFEQELWDAFQAIVRSGVEFAEEIDVTYARWAPISNSDKSTTCQDRDGYYYFLAKAIVANPRYSVPEGHCGDDSRCTVPEGRGENAAPIEFVDDEGRRRTVIPDISDLRWLVSILDLAAESKSTAKVA